MAEDAAIVDFETEGIQKRPDYPPRPAGVAIKLPGQKRGSYYAFGHKEQNNCEVGAARRQLATAFCAKRVVFHYASFDLDVAFSFFGLRPPVRYEDTIFLAFLNDPYERSLDLKELAHKHLGQAPEEKDRLTSWIRDNIKGTARKKKLGEYYWQAPGPIAGEYAVGDIERTERLYDKFVPIINKRDMREAYERELKVMPISLGMERSGICVDVPRLEETLAVFTKLDSRIKNEIRKRLGVKKSSEFNIDSRGQLAQALLGAEKLDSIIRTAKGNMRTNMESLRASCNDKRMLKLLAVHSVATKYISTYLKPWLDQAALTGGRILPKFNQTRNDGGGGARSGRFSSSDPNLQNIPTNPEESQNKETLELLQKWLLEVGYNFLGLRDYIVPDHGSVMICTDYNQQEVRFLAHFEDGTLCEAYRKNPHMDVHDFFRLMIKKSTHIDFPRKHVKVTVFGIIYGMGLAKLAARLGIDLPTAKLLRESLFKVCPGIPRIMNQLKVLAQHDKPLRTWGGREYFCEEPRYKVSDDGAEGRWINFEYKMFNYLIQPSAADYTKQGMINVAEQVPEVRIAVQVHDELVCMAPDRSYGEKIARAMCTNKLNVPMLADSKYSEETWARAK